MARRRSRVAAAAIPGVLAESTFTSDEEPDAYSADAATPVAFAPGDAALPAFGPISRRSGPNSGFLRSRTSSCHGPDGLCGPSRQSSGRFRRVRRCRKPRQSQRLGSTAIPMRRADEAAYIAAGSFADQSRGQTALRSRWPSPAASTSRSRKMPTASGIRSSVSQRRPPLARRHARSRLDERRPGRHHGARLEQTSDGLSSSGFGAARNSC